MAIVRFDPFRELTTMQDRINRIFGEMYTRRGDDDILSRGDWIPPVDIFENDKHEIVIQAEMPGLKK
jgi:HSP20 family protein